MDMDGNELRTIRWNTERRKSAYDFAQHTEEARGLEIKILPAHFIARRHGTKNSCGVKLFELLKSTWLIREGKEQSKLPSTQPIFYDESDLGL